MNNKVKFLRGTSDEYAVAEKDSDTIYFTTDDGKLYIGDKEITGNGSITIDDSLSDTSKNPVQNKVITNALKGTNQVTDNSSYSLENSVYYPLLGLNLFGSSVQDGTPTPENPVDIVSVGDNGFDIITKDDTHFNLLSVRDNGGEIITKQPVSVVGKNGETKQFIVSASGSGLTYQWWQNVNNGKDWTVMDSSAARMSTFTVPIADFRNGYKYRCVVTDSNGNSETSNEVTLYVVSDECEITAASIATDALSLCGIPVESGGNYTDSMGQQWIADELIYNADGTGKIVKHLNKAALNGSSDEVWASTTTKNGADTGTTDRRFYITMPENLKPIAWNNNNTICTGVMCDSYSAKSTNQTYQNTIGVSVDGSSNIIFYDSNYCTLTSNEWKTHLASNPITIVYQLATPFEIELTAAEVGALRTLQTFDGATSISNSSGAEMGISYCVNKNISETVNPLYQNLYKGLNDKADLSHTHDTVTATANGFMSAEDKIKLDNISVTATKVESSTTNGNIKINGIETTVYTHPSGTNPHGTTKSDVGLGNVPNVATNDQTPSYTEASSLTKLSSGEKLSVAFGKISKAITDLISHIGDSVKHITSTERTNWNSAKTHADSAHAPSNAQANVIETIKVNGTAITPSSKAVNITVPTVGNGTVTIKQGGTSKGSFTMNQSGNTTIELSDNNTWRDVVDNLESTDTTKSLSANQGKVLKGLVDGKASSSHTHNAMTGATADAAGTSGFVPAPTAGDQNKFLKADGTWSSPPSVSSSITCIVDGTGVTFTYEGNYKLFFYNIKGISPGNNYEVTYESSNGWIILKDTDTAVYRKLAYYSYQSGATSTTTVNYYLELSHGKIRITRYNNTNSSTISGVTLEIYAL